MNSPLTKQTKQIDTLVKDIYSVVTDPPATLPAADVEAFGRRLAEIISLRLSASGRQTPSLRLSNLGTTCGRKLWYSVRAPELGEPLSGSTRLKFLLGDIWEAVLLFLARMAGHEVTDEQKEVSVHGVHGHIDARIDGSVVDVKSASTLSFLRFKSHLRPADDTFGYITQLGTYVRGLGDSMGFFLVGDKTTGQICLDKHTFKEVDYLKKVTAAREILSGPLPERGFTDEKFGESGNRKLNVTCSYCAFKFQCWPSLRAYQYRKGLGYKIIYLTTVHRNPDVPEVHRSEGEPGSVAETEE